MPFVASLSDSEKDSAASVGEFERIEIEIVWLVSPGAKVSTPVRATKSCPAVALPDDVA
ncbi:hypothetical protein D3C83_331780 [compost metagenome]